MAPKRPRNAINVKKPFLTAHLKVCEGKVNNGRTMSKCKGAEKSFRSCSEEYSGEQVEILHVGDEVIAGTMHSHKKRHPSLMEHHFKCHQWLYS